MTRPALTVVLMQVEIEVQSATTSVNVPGDDLFQLWVESALTGKDGRFNLAIRIVDESEMQRFNLQYRNKDYVTNVLSFPAELPANLPEDLRESLLGDLLICAPVVVREAIEQRREAVDHWAHLTIHGVLHLLGYDHEQIADAQVMESLETDILAQLGISDPYLDLC
jgi:probable rRNA maturation factor